MLDLPEILARPGSILLDNSLCRRSTPGDKRSHLFRNPVAIIQCSTPEEVPDALAEIDHAVSDGLFAAGFLAYECGYQLAGGRFGHIVSINWASELDYPILWFGIYEDEVVLECGEVDKLLETRPEQVDAHLALNPRVGAASFADCIRKILDLIHEGDLYQLNYTIRFDGDLAEGDTSSKDPATGGGLRNSLDLFRYMRKKQPVNYSAYLQLGHVQIVSASPEQFFERNGEAISVKPMKGTAPRGETAQLDRMLEEWLKTDEKNRSENLMILDLLRNDLSRVCRSGSVTADSLFEIEKYRSVIQMTSPVAGRLSPGVTYQDIFSALFPSGSITGAPKIRAMTRIRELENEPRGIYCGSVGFIDPADKAAFSVAIRTVTVSGASIVTGSGGGIVWDSDAMEEYEECLLKTRYLSADRGDSEDSIRLVETMVCEGKIDLQKRHIRRLERSARALGFTFDRSAVLNSIDEFVHDLDLAGRFKIRLLLSADGDTTISSEMLPGKPRTSIARFGIAPVAVYSGNPFLYHKTTFRGVYNRARATAEEKGLDEVLFVNENQEVTEGTITNIFLRHGNLWKTPHADCGLLEGIGREVELESARRPIEARLFIDDVRSADEIILTNAVRGRRRAEFVE